MGRALVVKVTCGADDPERSNQGLTVAATAAASGADVSLWLTGEGAWLGTVEAPALDLPHATPSHDLVASLLDSGSTVTVCSQCAARRSIDDSLLLPGARVAGSVVFVEEILAPDTQALVY